MVLSAGVKNLLDNVVLVHDGQDEKGYATFSMVDETGNVIVGGTSVPEHLRILMRLHGIIIKHGLSDSCSLCSMERGY